MPRDHDLHPREDRGQSSIWEWHLLWPLPNMAALGFPPSAAAELVRAARNLVRSSTSVKRAKVLSAGDNLFLAKASASVGALLRSVTSLAPGATRAQSPAKPSKDIVGVGVRASERPYGKLSPGHSPGLFLHLLLNTAAHVRASLLFCAEGIRRPREP